MHVVTIAARNYLPFARLLARSFKRHNPSDTFVILLVDAEPGEISPEPDFEIATPADLPIDPDEFRRLALFYTVTELSTAMKPWALEMLLRRGSGSAMYLDPDIYVYSSLAELEVLSLEHGIVLTPHGVVPMPRDGLRPTEADIMGSGVYNLGFIAVGEGNVPMLHWWQERLRRDSISAPDQMLFTDQRWIDLVPSYWDCAILRDPGYNVAYWNLDNRPVERIDGELYAGGAPLRFFHFSGYRPETPWILSKYVADNPRVVLSEHPVVRELADEYGRLAADDGMTPGQTAEYRFNHLADGTPITRSMRWLYRSEMIRADNGKAEYPPPPFDPSTEAELHAWFLEPRGPGLNRLLMGVWESRPDLKQAFPGVPRGDARDFLGWAASSGVAEQEIPAAWLPRPSKISRADTPRTTTLPGVNLSGYFAAELGMGQGGRLLIEAVKESGLPFSTLKSERTFSRQLATFSASSSSLRYPINIAFVNADQFPLWVADVGPDLLHGRYTIGVWAWEIEGFPDAFQGALDLVDEVWAISEFVRDAITAKTSKPVFVLPLPIPLPPLDEVEPLDRAALGLSGEPYFLFVFDYLSVLERKNPFAAVEAFCRAFHEGEGPSLVIKTINGDLCRTDRERLRQACSGRSDIRLVEEYLAAGALRSLMANAAAYVSLHRSEGYGLTMSEAMSLGRPVIATGYSGNLDFMTAENSLLVPFELVRVGSGAGPYPASSHWAEADTEVAASYLRRIIDDPAFAQQLGRRARESVASTGESSIAATFVRKRVEAILAGRKVTARQRAKGPIRATRRLIQRTFPAGLLRAARRRGSGTYRALGRPVRRVVRRLGLQTEALGRLEVVVGDSQKRVRTLGARLDQTAAQVDALTSRSEELAARVDGNVDMSQDLGRRLDGAVARLNGLDFEMAARPYTADGQSLEHAAPDGSRYLGFGADGLSEGSYATFEDLFRGSEGFIKERLRPYLDLLTGHGPVLDVGCGRGEMLAILDEAGIPATGVDLDESMLERARAQGLSVAHGDALEYLASLPDASLGAVVSFQVVEHLPVAALRDLTQESMRVLSPGGVFIAETVNPHSPPALKVFWLDLTHVRPIFPESLLLLAQECGFESGKIFFPLGTGDLERNLRQCGEYAVVAYRGADDD